MNSVNIPIIRSLNQYIGRSIYKTAKEIAGWMGALQAQDYNMSKWAFGIRLHDSVEETINNEINSGGIIRTHLLRPTWHFASSDDIRWILELSTPQIKASLKYRDKQLDLTEKTFSKCNSVIEKALKDGNHLTREELIAELVKSGIKVDNNRASHILVRAEIDGIICSGRQKNSKPTYTLLEEWIPAMKKRIYREEALKELGLRYFLSRGPATIQDFNWWSGLSAGDSKLALELNKPDLKSETIESRTYWFGDSAVNKEADQKDIYLLPAYDEFLIGYRDRKFSISETNHKKAVSENGIFYPSIMKSGKIIGIWKRNIKNDTLLVSVRLFKTDDPTIAKMLEKSLTRYSEFTNKKATLVYEHQSRTKKKLTDL